MSFWCVCNILYVKILLWTVTPCCFPIRVESLIMKMILRFPAPLFVMLLLFFSGLFFSVAEAQIGQGIDPDEEGLFPGTIISRNPRTGYFHISRVVSDPNVFGVVVERPIINIQPDADSEVSVLRTGEVRVNIVLIGGDIEPGDYITTSEVNGYGMKAGEEHPEVIGLALEGLSVTDGNVSVLEHEGSEVLAGQIIVDLQIGRRHQDEGSSPISEDPSESGLTPLGSQVEHYLAVIARYLAAALVAISALLISLRFFRANVSGGLSALGRNPLARQSIQKMMLFNMFLVIVISVGGLMLSALILLIPVFISKVL